MSQSMSHRARLFSADTGIFCARWLRMRVSLMSPKASAGDEWQPSAHTCLNLCTRLPTMMLPASNRDKRSRAARRCTRSWRLPSMMEDGSSRCNASVSATSRWL
eukprot:5599339-Alexandrium_andersonii.AAC.1